MDTDLKFISSIILKRILFVVFSVIWSVICFIVGNQYQQFVFDKHGEELSFQDVVKNSSPTTVSYPRGLTLTIEDIAEKFLVSTKDISFGRNQILISNKELNKHPGDLVIGASFAEITYQVEWRENVSQYFYETSPFLEFEKYIEQMGWNVMAPTIDVNGETGRIKGFRLVYGVLHRDISWSNSPVGQGNLSNRFIITLTDTYRVD